VSMPIDADPAVIQLITESALGWAHGVFGPTSRNSMCFRANTLGSLLGIAVPITNWESLHDYFDLAQMPWVRGSLLPHLTGRNLNRQTMDVDSTRVSGLEEESNN
jgi:hypothetical protein